MKILVTGASGFIGGHLCKRLISRGYEVHGISREVHRNREAGLQWWQGDLSDEKVAISIVRQIRPQIIFHLASRVTGSRDHREVGATFRANLATTVNIMASILDLGCERVVLAGSSEEPLPGEDLIPCSPYAAAKLSATNYARMFQSLFQQQVVVPRIFMTYGPGQADIKKLVPYTILSLIRGESPKLSSGRRLVDWVYIDDLVDGLELTGFSKPLQKVAFDIGSGTLVSIREMVGQIAELIGNDVRPEFGAIPDRLYEPQRAADTSFAKGVLGWTPSVPLRQGLAQTIQWYRNAIAAIR